MARLATKSNPNSADAHMFVACALEAAGRFEEARRACETALRLNPFFPTWYRINFADIPDFGGHRDEAIKQYRIVLAAEPSFWRVHFRLAGLYAQAGQNDLAANHLREGRQANPACSIKSMLRFEFTKDEAARQRLADGLRRAGLE
jgi:Flp pilus assembly protein TadD